jgi:hypothetical protein
VATTAAAAAATPLMESLEALVAHIQGLSGSPEELAHLHSLLKQADGEPLRAHAAALVPFLAHLSPETHSLGYIYLLYVHLLRPNPNPHLRTHRRSLSLSLPPPNSNLLLTFPLLFAAGMRARHPLPI